MEDEKKIIMERRKVEERVEEIRNCPTWKLGWNNHMSEVIYRGSNGKA